MFNYLYISSFILFCLFLTNTGITDFSKSKNLPKTTVTNSSKVSSPANLYNRTLTDSLLKQHEFFIINTPIDINSEEKFIEKLPGSFEKSYLTGLLEKRKGNFSRSFDILYEILAFHPDYTGYYDELVFLAEINNKIPQITNYIKKSPNPLSVNIRYLQSIVYSSMGEYKKALTELSELAEKTSPPDPELLLQLSNVQRNLGDYSNALITLTNASRFSTNTPLLNIKVSNAEGALFYLSGKYTKAQKSYTDELKLSVKLNAKRYEAKALVNLGILLDEQGKVDSARNYYLRAINLSEEINDIETKAFACSELGVSYSFTSNLIESRNSYKKSYELYNKLGNKVRLSFLSNNIGKIYLNMFNFYSALNCFEEGLHSAGENKRAEVLNLIGIADVYANLSNYTKALEYYQKAKQLSSQIKDATLLTDVNIGLGTLNFNLNLTNNAINYFHAADDLCRNGGNPFISAGIYNKCGIVYFYADSLEKAEKYFNKSILFSRQFADSYTEASSMLELAGVFLAKKQPLKTEKILKDLKSIPVVQDYNYLMAQKEILYGKLNTFQKNFKSALRNFNNAKEKGIKLHENNIQIEANFEIGKLFEQQNLLSGAEDYYKEAYRLVENVSCTLNGNQEVQIAYFSGKNEIYKSLADLYLKQNRFDKAFEVIESSRSRNTMQNLNNLMVQSILHDKETLDKLYDYEWLLNSDYLSHSSLDSIRQQYDHFKTELFNSKPRLKDYIGHRTNLSISEIQKELSNDESILSIFSKENNTILFIISKDNFWPVQTNVSHKELLRLIGNISPYFNSGMTMAETYYNQDLFSFNAKASNELYTRIIQPAVKFIPENSKLIITSSAELSILPFEFLITSFNPNESSYDYKDKDYLIFKYNISYAPSASAYLRLKTSKLENSGRKLLLGDPSINYASNAFAERRGLLQESNPGLPRNVMLLPLKYSKEEIQKINGVINADKILVSYDATKENFMSYANLSSIIHLSTHSFLYNEQPFIFFSNTNSKGSDCFLEASEIAQLKLNSDLVVLSSCNSGLGLIDDAEGTIGMTKAFFEAGAKTIVVSLWDVNDNYTAKLMSLFYGKLGEGYNKSEALRQAKIEFIKKYSPNPYFWAAFVISGDTSFLKFKSAAGFPPIYSVLISLILITSSLIILKRYVLRRYLLRRKIFRIYSARNKK